LGDIKNGYLTLKVPTPPVNLKALEPAGFRPFITERENPVYFSDIGSQNIHLTFELPLSWSLVGSPENIQKESSIGSALLNIEIKDKKLSAEIVRSIKEKEVYSDNLLILRSLYTIWEKKTNNYLVFKTK
jgi:hypothetical protein